MTLTQQWRYLNLTRNSLYILFPAKDIMSYWQFISSFLYVRLKRACSLAGRALSNTYESSKYLKCQLVEISQKAPTD